MPMNKIMACTSLSHVNIEDETDSVNFDDVTIDSVDEAYAYHISLLQLLLYTACGYECSLFCTNGTIDINYASRLLHYASIFFYVCLNTSITYAQNYASIFRQDLPDTTSNDDYQVSLPNSPPHCIDAMKTLRRINDNSVSVAVSTMESL